MVVVWGGQGYQVQVVVDCYVGGVLGYCQVLFFGYWEGFEGMVGVFDCQQVGMFVGIVYELLVGDDGVVVIDCQVVDVVYLLCQGFFGQQVVVVVYQYQVGFYGVEVYFDLVFCFGVNVVIGYYQGFVVGYLGNLVWFEVVGGYFVVVLQLFVVEMVDVEYVVIGIGSVVFGGVELFVVLVEYVVVVEVVVFL